MIGTLSQEPREIQEFRIHSDFFFDPALSWETLLLNMSERLQYDWRVKNWIRRAKIEIKNGNPKDLEKLFKKALTLKITHWEILELQGLLATFRNDLELARELYFRALEMNPCAPSTYIQLFQISAFTKKDFHVAQALEYCPNHPQIKSLVERMSS